MHEESSPARIIVFVGTQRSIRQRGNNDDDEVVVAGASTVERDDGIGIF